MERFTKIPGNWRKRCWTTTRTGGGTVATQTGGLPCRKWEFSEVQGVENGHGGGLVPKSKRGEKKNQRPMGKPTGVLSVGSS